MSNAYSPAGGVRPSGLTGTTAGVSAWAGHPAVAVYACSLALLHVLLISFVVITALYTEKHERREAALEILRILTGVIVSAGSAKDSCTTQELPLGHHMP